MKIEGVKNFELMQDLIFFTQHLEIDATDLISGQPLAYMPSLIDVGQVESLVIEGIVILLD